MTSASRALQVQPGVLVKLLVLAFGAAYLGMVFLTNLVNFAASASDQHWTFLNSGNADYIASIVKVYSWPTWFDDLAVLGAAVIEGTGAVLFVRALLRFRGGGTGITEAYQALAWNLGVWIAFIMGTEFFVAYPSESPFRELLALGFLMVLVVALVPDEAGGSAEPRRPEPSV